MKIVTKDRAFELPLSQEKRDKLFIEFSRRMMEEYVEQEASAFRPVKKAVLRDKHISDIKRPRDRKIVIGACKCCKKPYFVWLNPGRDHYTYVCANCEENNFIKETELTRGAYRCPSCNRKYSFWVNGKKSFSINCKDCNGLVKLTYDKKDDLMTCIK